MGFALFSILGLGALLSFSGFFDGGDNGRSEDDDDNPPEEQPSENAIYDVESGDTLDAGDGNDTISSSDDVVETVTVDGGAGDDLLDFAGIQGTHTLTGGDGQDTITSTAGYGSQVFGGDGDDILRAGGAGTNVFGGDGNDTIDIAANTGSDETNEAVGGGGDDSLTAYSAIEQRDVGGVALTGGTGQDDFTFAIRSVDDPVTDPDSPFLDNPARAGTIRDFNPDQDRLVIDLSDLEAGLALSSFSIVENASQGGSSEVLLNFSNGAQGIIWLPGATGLNVADINIVT